MSTEQIVATAATRGRRALFVRRGLVALAAGVLAGVSTKFGERTAEAAAGDNFIIGNQTAGFPTGQTAGTSPTWLTGNVSSGLGLLRLENTGGRALYASTTAGSNAIYAESTSAAAINGTNLGSNAGVFGTAIDSFALLGTSTNSVGLYGSSLGSQSGVLGVSTSGIGVRGESGINPSNNAPNGNVSAAVYGNAIGGNGVEGVATTGIGVRGQSNGNTGVYGISSANAGVYGTSTSNAGVWGNSSTSIGVYGVGSTGVFGQSTDGTGVNATTTNGVALRTNGRSEMYGDVEVGDFETQPPNGSSPAFNLNVTGELRVNGQKLAIVRGGDGEYRKFYSLESAECYFEDFGAVKMSGGRARVDIAADFREFVDPARGFYIQLTPLGANNGLYVSGKDLTGFDITEANGGASELEVQYRIVARRADVPGDRLARVNPTALRAHEKKVRETVPPSGEANPAIVNERRRVDVPPPPVPPTQPGQPSGSTPERRSR